MLSARQIIISLSIKNSGDWEAIFEDIKNKNTDDLEKYYAEYENSSFSAVTILDNDYPETFKSIYRPPFVLFYYGDISLLSNTDKCVSIIGSRNPSKYGEEITKKIANPLSKQYIIVSGMAKGIDGITHRCALSNKGKTVAILGSGIDYCYPDDNEDIYEIIKSEHLLISEYFGEVTPDRNHFPDRNRLIAAASKVLLVTEAKKQSGTSITVNFAINFGKTVMACPANADTNSLCNSLIKEGACLAEKAEDIVEEMEGFLHFKKENEENVK